MSPAAVVFDLDGTLVRLAVDWDAVATELAGALADRDVAAPHSIWAMLQAADAAGHRATIEDIIARHERAGARDSRRLPAADTVPDGPTGVCSLNCVDACHIALETHGIAGIDAVVGRDSVATEKPDPEPLLATIDRLGVDPGDAVFVGDSERDRETAANAGVDYRDVDDWLRAYA